MIPHIPPVAWVAVEMPLLPVAWLWWLDRHGQKRDIAWWWLAVAFLISGLADNLALFLSQPGRHAVSFVYSIIQASLIGAVFLSMRWATQLATFLAAATFAALFWRGPERTDIVLHAVSFLTVVAVTLRHVILFRLRLALLVYFGLGLVAWACYVARPNWPTWYGWEGTRLAGLLLFCWAAVQTLRLSRSTVRG